MESRALRYFIAAAEELHVGRAAEQLGIAQPALSQQIKILESRLGVRLFHRARRRIELTDAGRLYLREAKALIAASERAVRLARAADRGTAGELDIGYSGSVILEPQLHEVLRRFRADCPDVTLSMHEGAVQQLLDALAADKLDIAFLRGPIGATPAGIAAQHFVATPLVAALPADHRLAGRSRIAMIELAEEPFIALPDPPGVGLAHSLNELAARAGFAPRIALRAGSVMSVLGLVGAGLGVSIVPDLPVPASSGVVLRPLDDAEPSTEVLLLTRSTMTSAVEKRFIALAQPASRDEAEQ